MTIKLPKLLFFLFVFALFLPRLVLSSGFYLKTIGSLDVSGSSYSQYWYTNEGVTFTGYAPAGTEVTATINGASGTVVSDSSGDWSYAATLVQGDNSVSFTSAVADPLSLTVTIGDVPEGVGGLEASDTPPAGIAYPTILILFGGTSLILLSIGALYKTKGLKKLYTR